MKCLIAVLFLSLCQQFYAQQGGAETAYKLAIHKADSSYEFKWMQGIVDHNPFYKPQFERSRKLYQAALQLNPAETYPKSRLIEINHVLDYFNSAAVYSTADSLFRHYRYSQALKAYRGRDSLSSTTEAGEKIMLCRDLLKIRNSDSAKRITSIVVQTDSICHSTDMSPNLMEGASEGPDPDKEGYRETYYLKDNMEGGTLYRIRNIGGPGASVRTTFYYQHKKIIRAHKEVDDPQHKTIYKATYYYKDGVGVKSIGEDRKFSNGDELYKEGLKYIRIH
ncbi:MAG: hypothetical protein ACHQRM_04550 [Bacteroidia bacterium]